MGKKVEEDRRRAVQRFLSGEKPAAIYGSMGYSRPWFYKWVERSHQPGVEDWFGEQSRRPHHSPQRTPGETEEIVKLVRLSLYNQGLFCGPQAIQWELGELSVQPVPSVRTIARILARHDLTHRRTGRYEPKGKRYPALVALQPGDVHQSDFVGPCYLKGPVRFHSLHSVDLLTRRCAVHPLLARDGQSTLAALWAMWNRLGMPRHQQVDNDTVFYGSPTHPRGMGMLIRLCLRHGIEPWFIPPAEPWRNGVVEKFNHHWEQKFLRRVVMQSPTELARDSLRFEQLHNTRYRYSALGGKTPAATLAASDVALRFPATPEPPQLPLAKPESGRYHLIRFIRSDAILDIFGERFPMPAQTVYEYVRATVDVGTQRLAVYLDATLIDERDYRLR